MTEKMGKRNVPIYPCLLSKETVVSVNLIIESQIHRRKEAALFYLNPIECGLGLRLGAKQNFPEQVVVILSRIVSALLAAGTYRRGFLFQILAVNLPL